MRDFQMPVFVRETFNCSLIRMFVTRVRRFFTLGKILAFLSFAKRTLELFDCSTRTFNPLLRGTEARFGTRYPLISIICPTRESRRVQTSVSWPLPPSLPSPSPRTPANASISPRSPVHLVINANSCWLPICFCLSPGKNLFLQPVINIFLLLPFPFPLPSPAAKTPRAGNGSGQRERGRCRRAVAR